MATSPSTQPDASESKNGLSQTAFDQIEPVTQAIKYYQRLDGLIEKLESRVREMEPDGDRSKHSRGGATGPGDDKPVANPVQRTKIAEVRECDWEHFINRFSPDEPLYAIEVLVAGSQLERDKATEDSERGKWPEHFQAPDTRRSSQVSRAETNTEWIHRIRIQSKELLAVLGEVTGHAWGNKPHTFVRPFQYLIQSYDKVKLHLEHMKEDQTSSGNPDLNGSHSEDKSYLLDEVLCYVKFVADRLLPSYKALHGSTLCTQPKIRFDDLPYLFKPGELMFVPSKALEKAVRRIPDLNLDEIHRFKESQEETAMHQKIWRCFSGKVYPEHEFEDDECDSFLAEGYYLDYDGSSYGAVCLDFEIFRFEGEKCVNELEFYPLRFANNWKQFLDQQKEPRRLFVDAISRFHMSCDGWTLTTNPMGVPIIDYKSPMSTSRQAQKKPEFIDGQVIIDFREAINSEPEYAETFVNLEIESHSQTVGPTKELHSPDKITTWSNAERRSIMHQSYEVIVVDDSGYTKQEYSQYINNDPYLRKSTWPRQAPSDDDLVLLPLRVFVYSLRKRKFVPVDVRRLRAISVERNAFQHLQLPAGHKHVIDAAVQSHLRRQIIERKIEENGATHVKTQDFIPGKGRGLLIMLHGEPGVGKTATAEAVAQETGRPLFPISCNDLGPNFWMLEKTLDEIFRLAHLWDCVLLMDEADVILSTRSAFGGSNNAHVSIFLRKLEYYNGILLLTTNRAGKLDPAMSSRIHIILHYKRLGRPEIEEVFQINIKRLQQAEEQQFEASGEPPLFIMEQDIMKFVNDHWNKHPKGKGAWNGRQIRNAFVVAASLARREAEQPGLGVNSGFRPHLRALHFQEVEKLIDEYDGFRAHVLGGDDSRKARLNEERDDDYEGSSERQPHNNEVRSDIIDLMNAKRALYADQGYVSGPLAKGNSATPAAPFGVGVSQPWSDTAHYSLDTSRTTNFSLQHQQHQHMHQNTHRQLPISLQGGSLVQSQQQLPHGQAASRLAIVPQQADNNVPTWSSSGYVYIGTPQSFPTTNIDTGQENTQLSQPLQGQTQDQVHPSSTGSQARGTAT